MPDPESQVRERIDSLVTSLRAKHINALMAHYAPSVVTFDLMLLQCQGVDAYRKNFEAWFASVQGPIDFEIHELRIGTGEDVAFAHYLGRVTSGRTTGEKNDYWVRVTAGFQKMNGRWMITHEHVSVPFLDMETMQAALTSSRRSVPG